MNSEKQFTNLQMTLREVNRVGEGQKNVPKLRFKGYEDAWEQRKAGELLIERNEQAPMSIEYPLMAFIANEGVAPKGERYDRSALVTDTENKLYKRTEFGDFIYSSNNLETGSIGLNKYGKACISPVYSIFQPTGIANSDFLGRRLVRKDFINSMVKWRQGVVYGQWRIHESDFLKIEIHVPSVEEQRQIGTYLDCLDYLITLHQRKYDALKSMKKTLLSKIFPKNGEDVPEIRFKEFTDAWEQRKLGDITTFNKGKGYSKKDLVENGTPIILYGRLYTDYQTLITKVDTFVTEVENSVISEGWEVIVPASGESAEDISRASVVVESGIILGGDLNIINKCSLLNPVFLALTISNGNQQKEMSKRAQGKSVVHLHNSDLKEINLLFPEIKEQSLIGEYFEKIDNLITLHQRKLDELKNMKKTLLQQMFV